VDTLNFSYVGWVDAVPTQHLSPHVLGCEKKATQPMRLRNVYEISRATWNTLPFVLSLSKD